MAAEALCAHGVGKAAYNAFLNALYGRPEHKVHILLIHCLYAYGLIY